MAPITSALCATAAMRKNLWAGQATLMMTQGYVSADIQLIVNDAARNALHQHSKITMELLKAAISNTRPSLSADELRKYDRIRKMMNGEDVKKPNDRPRIGFNI